MFNFNHEHIEYTFDLSEEIIPSSPPTDNNGTAAATSTVAQKIAELELRIEELEKRVSELEGQK